MNAVKMPCPSNLLGVLLLSSVNCFGVEGGTSLDRPTTSLTCTETKMKRHMVKVQIGSRFCSGVLINGNRVITAGHCFRYIQPSEEIQYNTGRRAGLVEIQVFDSDSNSYKPVRGEFRVATHYNGPSETGVHDIALISLDTEIPNIDPLRLAVTRAPQERSRRRPSGDRTLLASGFAGGPEPRYLSVEQIPSASGPSSPRALITSTMGEDIQPGDSGGPVFQVDADKCKVEVMGVNKSAMAGLGLPTFSPASIVHLERKLKEGLKRERDEAALLALMPKAPEPPPEERKPKVSAIPVEMLPPVRASGGTP